MWVPNGQWHCLQQQKIQSFCAWVGNELSIPLYLCTGQKWQSGVKPLYHEVDCNQNAVFLPGGYQQAQCDSKGWHLTFGHADLCDLSIWSQGKEGWHSHCLQVWSIALSKLKILHGSRPSRLNLAVSPSGQNARPCEGSKFTLKIKHFGSTSLEGGSQSLLHNNRDEESSSLPREEAVEEVEKKLNHSLTLHRSTQWKWPLLACYLCDHNIGGLWQCVAKMTKKNTWLFFTVE